MRKKIVAGNWKMNGDRSLVTTFSASLDSHAVSNVDIVLCPPAVYLPLFSSANFSLGGQDLSAQEPGAHTGDVSGEMLKDVGCSYVIVGHSERREDHGESNSDVAKKASKALACGLTPIICIGEPLAVREAGEVEAFLSEQLKALVEHLSVDDLSKSVIAYEPIWAIGTGKTASPEQAQDVHKFIREFFANEDKTLAEGLRILYGGSVKPDNAKTLFAQADVDGGLIGGASLKVEDFISICQAAN